jgi:hypothetical protein
MTDNQKHLIDTRTHIKEFEATFENGLLKLLTEPREALARDALEMTD